MLSITRRLSMSAQSTDGASTTSGVPRKASLVSSVTSPIAEGPEVDPEELFTKRTVTEVRIVQQKLRCGTFIEDNDRPRSPALGPRADADAKQEELRLMVGERYRDLLQASASIISIAKSSKHVLEALKDVQGMVEERTRVRQHKRSIAAQKDDSQLRALQSLAAHVKLLLDAPEHLWRLLEHKKYLHASWLFMLARVVHRSLANDDPSEEEGWYNQGIDVLEQFPLAQRQWETISHFRTQITHKATLSLRESAPTTPDACATLLALHLVDSRPLTETLAVFLAQRQRAVQHALGRRADGTRSRQATIDESADSKKRSGKAGARQVRRIIEGVIYIMFGTLQTARAIFAGADGAESTPLMRQVLDYITKEETSAFASTLPSDLCCSTYRLLSALPSSSQLILLPPNLRAYKPYVDLSSPSTTVAPTELKRKLGEWFGSTVETLRKALRTWLESIEHVRLVWALRTWAREYIGSTKQIEDEEKKVMRGVFDEACKERVTTIWRVALEGMKGGFAVRLTEVVKLLADGDSATIAKATPTRALFDAPSADLNGRSNLIMSGSSLDHFKTQLGQRVVGRTSVLDSVLSPLEDQSHRLKMDLEYISSIDIEEKGLVDSLIQIYHDDAEKTCIAIVNALKDMVASAQTSPDMLSSMNFIGRVAHALATSSLFIINMNISESKSKEFQSKATSLHIITTDHWRTHIISTLASFYHEAVLKASLGRSLIPKQESSSWPHPSAPLIETLLALTGEIQEITADVDMSKCSNIARLTLEQFILRLDKDVEYRECNGQDVSDFAFLREIIGKWGSDLSSSYTLLDARIASMYEKAGLNTATAPNTHIERHQLIFDALLPAQPLALNEGLKPTSLLPFGVPPAEAEFQPAMDIVKPSSRFGLLLVGPPAM